MIYNDGKIYATVWENKVSENGKYADLKISTGEKDPDGKWKNSTWFPRVIGHALNSIKNAKHGDRIVITKSKFSNETVQQDEDTYRTYFRFIVLEAAFADKPQQPAEDTERQKPTVKKQSAEENVQVVQEQHTDEDDPW